MNWHAGLKASVDARFPLERVTTFRIGGPARWAVRPRDAETAAEVLRRARAEGLPIRVVGMGSNLLVSDEGVDGVVFLMRSLRALRFDGPVVTAGAGVTNGQILKAARARGLAGLRCLVGYPGTLGGAVRMNAGGAPGYIEEVVEWVRGIDATGNLVTRTRGDCGFRYRGSDLDDLLVLEVRLSLRADVDAEEEALACHDILAKKRAAQPLGDRSAGCVWRNPAEGPSAGLLVDRAGLKGLAVGGAQVSPRHGNFIVNRGGATCADVLALMTAVRRRVEDFAGVRLESEVIHWADGAAVAI